MSAKRDRRHPSRRSSWGRLGLCLGLIMGSSAVASLATATPSKKSCTKLAKTLKTAAKSKQILTRARAGTPSVTSARWTPATASLPEHCDVLGFVYTTNSSDASRTADLNRVGFQVRLPTDWNRKLHFRGVGGYAGSIPTQPARVVDPLTLGYATAGTDTGHTGAFDDASFAADATKLVDFLDRGVHAATVAVKDVITRYYAEPPLHSYFEGCSGGGRQAVWEAMAYPNDFDGVIAGAPAGASPDIVTWSWNQTHMYPDPAQLTTPALPLAKLSALGAAVLARCDSLDGIADGILDDPRECDFDAVRDVAQCAAGDEANPSCLSAAESAVVNAILRGPDVGPALPGPLPGGEATPLGWDHWIVQSPNYRPNLQYVFAEEHFEQIALAPKSFRDFDFETRAMQLPAVAGQRLDLPLGPFQQRGGKLLLWHGYNDPVLSPLGSIDLFERATDEIGPVTRDDFLRLYMLPGVFHCNDANSPPPGPSRFDALGALERWVERNEAPDAIVASHPSGRTRPLCPYPQRARRIDPNGSVDDADNFRCEAP